MPSGFKCTRLLGSIFRFEPTNTEDKTVSPHFWFKPHLFSTCSVNKLLPILQATEKHINPNLKGLFRPFNAHKIKPRPVLIFLYQLETDNIAALNFSIQDILASCFKIIKCDFSCYAVQLIQRKIIHQSRPGLNPAVIWLVNRINP